MPRMNGFELCRYIKQKPDLNYCLLYTSYRFNGEKIKKYNLPDLLRKNSQYINDIFGDNEERILAVTSQ